MTNPTVYLSPGPPIQQFNQDGIPLAGGQLFVYLSNTTTKTTTWTDDTGSANNTNPIILDANGQCQIWLAQGVSYTYVLAPATDTDPPTDAFWTVNGVVGMNSSTPAGATGSAAASALTYPTSLSAYTMQGIACSITPSRSGTVQATVYGTITASNGTEGVGLSYFLCYGIGAAPTNGAAQTGVPVGLAQLYTNPTTVTPAGVQVPFCISMTLTGLTTGVTYWIDLAAESLGVVASAGFENVQATAVEL